MKYHYKFPGDIKSACGRAKESPDSFLFDMEGFVQHFDDNGRCKTCKKIVMDMSKKGYVGLSLMIIVDSWR